MKRWILVLGLGALAASFPTAENTHRMGMYGNIDKRCPLAEIQAQVQSQAKEKHQEKRLLSSSLDTPVDISGEHAFQPPDFAAGDQRGPCPALNALANHGYLPHNGVASFGEAVAAVNQVYGMGLDISLVLATMGTVYSGNALSLDPGFSIGGPDPRVSNILGNVLNLFGEPQGLDRSHNFVEADASNTRNDLYVTGNAWTLNMTLFNEWYEMSTDGTFSMELMGERAKIRFDQAKATNPNFYYGPATGLIFRNAGYLFSGRLFRNHSQDNTEGVLTKDIVRNFYGIYGEEGNFTYREGWERIPENWYRTPSDWDIVNFNADLIPWLVKYPELASIGGNTGTVNSFTGVDLSDITGGVFNATTLLAGNNLVCFVFEALKVLSPNALAGLYKTLAVPLKLLTDTLAAPLLDLACPAFDDMQLGGQPLWTALQDLFPGALKSSSAL
ncbi:hypothetical protein ARAM_003076 [Aspergillus rambellii]|uniref:Heme haloperoxidase family profile domain-containing protein n=1 Tax=Aspergillus rambellii TaxID=308745 RepID=A0A0F8WF74_9EURO|nr:hypothetical protein ARAM_003076 [Aspergillus rambellii]